MKRNRISAPTRVADAAFLAAQARWTVLRRQEDDLRQQIKDLQSNRQSQASRKLADDPALRAGADGPWLQWIAARQAALNAALARLQVQKARQFAEVKQAFGRRQAMRALASQKEAEERQLRARRDMMD